MPKFDQLPPKLHAERLSNSIIGLLAGNSGVVCMGSLALSLLFVLEDPSLPARPQAMEDLLGAVKEFLTEWNAFASGDQRFFAEKYGDVGVPRN